jgi:hypothetical protein
MTEANTQHTFTHLTPLIVTMLKAGMSFQEIAVALTGEQPTSGAFKEYLNAVREAIRQYYLAQAREMLRSR